MRILLRLSSSCKLLVGLTIMAFLFSAGTAYADKDLAKIMKHLAKKCEKKYAKKSQKCIAQHPDDKKKELKCIKKAEKKLDECIDPKAIIHKADKMSKAEKKQILKFEKAVDACQAKNDKCAANCAKKKEGKHLKKCTEKCTKKQEECINKAIKTHSQS